MADRTPGDLRAETGDPRTLVRMLVLGEALTRRGELGPLARFWKPAPGRGPRVRRDRRDDRAGG